MDFNPNNKPLGFGEVEIDVRGLASASLNPSASGTSSQRLTMDSAHLKQHLCLIDGDVRRFFTGTEREYAKQGIMSKFDGDCVRVVEVISKYAGAIPKDMQSPLTLIVYERKDNNQIDVLELPSYHLSHPKYGFMMERTQDGKRIAAQKAYPADTILAKPPSITNDLDYKFGKEVNVFLGNCKAGTEDGAWISDELAYEMRTQAFGELEMNLSKKDIPLNINGTINNHKPIPDIGDYLREDGLVMAWREYYRDFPMSLYNKEALTIHTQLDKLRYGEIPNRIEFALEEGQELLTQPRVIDIEVIKGGSNKAPITKAEKQLNMYWERTVRFYEQILRTHEELERLIPGYELSPAWQRWVDSSYFYVYQPQGTRTEVFKREQLPNWYVKVVYSYVFIPTIGAKFTNIHAGKTVVVKKTPRSEMPNHHGIFADFVVEDISIINRMNEGVPMEMRLGSCHRTAWRELQRRYEAGESIETLFELCNEFITKASPFSKHIIDNPIINKKELVEHYVKKGLEAFTPPAFGAMGIEILKALTQRFPPIRAPLNVTNNLGEVEQTEDPAEIGTLYMMLLERTGDGFAAVNSAKRQHHGIPTKASRSERNSFPVKISSTRFPSEADTKSIQSHLNNEGINEMMDRSLNPVSHRMLNRALIRSIDPANIEDAVPRHLYPRQGNRVIAYRDALLFVGGIRLKEGKDGNAILPGDEGYNE